MDERDESEGGVGDGAPRGEQQATSVEPETAPLAEGLKIAAVEAAVAAGLAPSTGRRLDADRSPEGLFGSIELPDWSDPPTGQVPRILLGPDAEDVGGGAPSPPGPTWREDRADWEQEVDLSFLVGDDPAEPSGIAGRTSPDTIADDPFDFSFAELTIPSPPRSTGPDRALVTPGDTDRDPLGAERARGETLAPDGAPDEGDDADADVAWAQLLDPGDVVGERDLGALGRRPRRSRRAGSHRRPGNGGAEASAVAQRPAPLVAAGSPKATASPPTAARERAQGRSPVVATATGIVAGGVALACFVAGSLPSLLLVTLLVTLGAGEAFGALRRAGHRPATALGLVAVPCLVVGAYLHGTQGLVLVFCVTILLGFAWYLVDGLRSHDVARRPASDLGVTLLVVGWVGVLGSFAGLLVAPSIFPHRHGVGFLAATVLLTVAADVGAYATGAKLGRHRMAPLISPHKSWEGFLGGTVLVFAVAATVVARIHPLSMPLALLLAAIVAVLAPVGDLAESLVKRDLKVKDMGTLLPAHGGVLDRVDAMLFVLPVAYYVLRLVHPA